MAITGAWRAEFTGAAWDEAEARARLTVALSYELDPAAVRHLSYARLLRLGWLCCDRLARLAVQNDPSPRRYLTGGVPVKGAARKKRRRP